MSLPPNTACAVYVNGQPVPGGREFVGVDWGDDGYGAFVIGHQDGDGVYWIDEAETFRQGVEEFVLMFSRPGLSPDNRRGRAFARLTHARCVLSYNRSGGERERKMTKSSKKSQ